MRKTGIGGHYELFRMREDEVRQADLSWSPSEGVDVLMEVVDEGEGGGLLAVKEEDATI